MADVVELDKHRPPSDPELVKHLRFLLSEAQNGRMTEFACVYTSGESVGTLLHFNSNLEAAGAIALLHAEALAVPEE